MKVNFTLRGDRQQPLGTAVLFVSSSATLNPRSGEWSEEITVEATDFTGSVKSVSVSAEAFCTSKCKVTKGQAWPGVKNLTNLGTAFGKVSYSNVPTVGVVDSTSISYRLFVTQPGTTPTKPNVEWANPRTVRCDSALTGGGNTSTGCALPSITPELELPLSTYGGAAAAYTWAQYNLPNKWGLYSGSPLTRALDGDSRREKTCGSRSTLAFVPKPDVVPDDSCDEFPFASTYQGGTDGAQCAEIVPLLENGKWKVYEADPARPVKYTEPCVRAHVTLPMNRLAGTAYTNLIQSQRLVDKDPFHVSTPDA